MATKKKPAKAASAPARKRGGQTLRNAEVEARIFAALRVGIPLTVVCREEGMPEPRTVREWQQLDTDFGAAIVRAREEGEEVLAWECKTIADTPQEGVTYETDEKGETKEKRGDMLQHRKLQIETRLKLLAKFNPKRWGEKVQLAGDPENPLMPASAMTDAQLIAIAQGRRDAA